MIGSGVVISRRSKALRWFAVSIGALLVANGLFVVEAPPTGAAPKGAGSLRPVPLIDSPEFADESKLADEASPVLPAGSVQALRQSLAQGPADPAARGAERSTNPASGLSRGRPDAKVAREVVEDRAPDRRVVEMDDGTRRLELHAEPVWFKDASGKWRDIDTRVTPDQASGDGWLRSTANSWTARFGPVGPAGGVRVVSEAGSEFGFTPRGPVLTLAFPSLGRVTPLMRLPTRAFGRMSTFATWSCRGV